MCDFLTDPLVEDMRSQRLSACPEPHKATPEDMERFRRMTAEITGVPKHLWNRLKVNAVFREPESCGPNIPTSWVLRADLDKYFLEPKA